jgi:hypothetical protein
MNTTDLRPAWISLGIAGRLLNFVPPAAINHYRSQHPDEFANSPSERRIAMADIDKSPRRTGPVTVAELLAADRACDADRAKFRFYNAQRPKDANVRA